MIIRCKIKNIFFHFLRNRFQSIPGINLLLILFEAPTFHTSPFLLINIHAASQKLLLHCSCACVLLVSLFIIRNDSVNKLVIFISFVSRRMKMRLSTNWINSLKTLNLPLWMNYQPFLVTRSKKTSTLINYFPMCLQKWVNPLFLLIYYAFVLRFRSSTLF